MTSRYLQKIYKTSLIIVQSSFCHKELEIRVWPDMHPPPPSPSLWAFVFTRVSNFLISAYRLVYPLLFFPSLVFYCSPSLYLFESDLGASHFQQYCICLLSFTLIQVIPLMELCNLYKMNELVIQTLLSIINVLRNRIESQSFLRDWLAYTLMHVTFDILFLKILF